jgi:tripartite-type tricarboxylate transporter receptor subunit TctC
MMHRYEIPARSNTPEEFRKLIASEIRRWGPFLERAQLKLE